MRFMVSLTPKATTKPEEIQALVPAEQAQTGKLLKEGALEALYIAQRGAWTVVKADSAEKAHEVIKTLPMYSLLDHTITPLLG